MTKKQIVNAFAKKYGLSKAESRREIDWLFGLIEYGLKNNQTVEISGFGRFIPNKKSERVGRNPKTLEEHIIAERIDVKFKMGKKLKENLNKK